jgi:KDO2-lipid IV(A) lauroyltransferase
MLTLMMRLLLWLLQGLHHLPLSWVRALGYLLGAVLFKTAGTRRRIAKRNLDLCFPEWNEAQKQQCLRQHFTVLGQSLLDRSWLWHAPAQVLRKRLQITLADGQIYTEAEEQQQKPLLPEGPLMLFAPHFAGLDAGWTALTLWQQRQMAAIYTHAPNPLVDQWMLDGRLRFHAPRALIKSDGTRTIVQHMRQGKPFHLSPDMDYGQQGAVFVPFFGIPAATVTTLSRLPRLAHAQVMPVTTRLTPQGYAIQLHPPWSDYPTEDAQADTLHMQGQLEHLIQTMPEQYHWVHKRFKTRPTDEASLYDNR